MMDRNNTNFPLQLLEFFKQAEWGSEYACLKYYQNLVRVYMNAAIGARGLLIFHEMGMGKSILAMATTIDLMQKYSPILLLTKSLHSNMRGAIKKYINMRAATDPEFAPGKLDPQELDKWITEKFSFVSMNASNMITQIRKAADGNGAREFDAAMDSRLGEVVKLGSLDGKLLIVDEAHNLFRAITNGSGNALALYDMIMRARNLRLLYLTGTPIANDPFELVSCFNTLVGSPILPESYREFNKLFVDREKGTIKNREKFQNRLFGLVSFVDRNSTPGRAIGVESDHSAPKFPEVLPMKVELVNMDQLQYVQYQLARDKEMEEGGGGGDGRRRNDFGEPPSMTKPKSGMASTYRVRSRQLSNYCPPETFEEAELADLPEDSLASAKYRKCLANIKKHPNQLGLVYSQFVGKGGLGTFARFLKASGWHQMEFDAGIHGGSEPDTRFIHDTISALEYYSRNGKSWWENRKVTGRGDDEPERPAEQPSDTDNFRLSDELIANKITFRYAKEEDVEIIKSFTPDYEHNPANIKWPNYILIIEEDHIPTGYACIEFSCCRGKITAAHGNFGKDVGAAIVMEVLAAAITCARGLAQKSGGVAESSKEESVTSIDASGANPLNRPDRVPTFCVISGEVAPEDRTRLEKIFTGQANKHGDICDLILISSTGAEGLDLKWIRHIHIMEPYWNMGRLFQVNSRGARNDSHSDLPADEQNVQSYLYIAIPPESEKVDGVYPPTTDAELYEESLKDQDLVDSFTNTIKEVSIECLVNDGANCRKCSPTGVPLFTSDAARDIRAPDPCIDVKDVTIKADEIEFDGHKYHYVADESNIYGYKIFLLDPAIDSYRQLSEGDIIYAQIAAAIDQQLNQAA